MRKIDNRAIYIGTFLERDTNFPSSLTDYEGAIYYETDTERRYNIWRGEWVQIPPIVLWTTSTDGNLTEMFQDGPGGGTRIDITPDDSAYFVDIKCVAHRTDVANESAGLGYRAVVDNNGGTVALVGVASSYYDNQDNAWTLDIGVIGGSLQIRVRGQAAKTIKWVAQVELVKVANDIL